MSAISKVMCREGDKTVLAFGNVFSTLPFMKLMEGFHDLLRKKLFRSAHPSWDKES
jgi:hypothetical protein